jgi:hypothetical protein
LIGTANVTSLAGFLAGFAFGRAGSGGEEDQQFLAAFNEWVHAKYKITSTQSWDKIIEFFSPDAASAFGQFWQLYDEFLETRSP